MAKYKKGAATTSGQTQFQFHAARLDFHSTSYEWLVVAGSRAHYKGWGTLNGVEGYRFFLTALDGDAKGTDGVDRFRIRIWDAADGKLIYDKPIRGRPRRRRHHRTRRRLDRGPRLTAPMVTRSGGASPGRIEAMTRLSPHEIEVLLAGPHQAVLSVSRSGRGPVAVPMSYEFAGGRFYMITSPESLHGRLMQETGCITLTVHHEEYPDGGVRQWYVMAEGTCEFTGDDPAPLLRRLLAKDRGEEYADRWTERSLPQVTSVAVMTPRTLAGYRFTGQLD